MFVELRKAWSEMVSESKNTMYEETKQTANANTNGIQTCPKILGSLTKTSFAAPPSIVASTLDARSTTKPKNAGEESEVYERCSFEFQFRVDG